MVHLRVRSLTGSAVSGTRGRGSRRPCASSLSPETRGPLGQIAEGHLAIVLERDRALLRAEGEGPHCLTSSIVSGSVPPGAAEIPDGEEEAAAPSRIDQVDDHLLYVPLFPFPRGSGRRKGVSSSGLRPWSPSQTEVPVHPSTSMTKWRSSACCRAGPPGRRGVKPRTSPGRRGPRDPREHTELAGWGRTEPSRSFRLGAGGSGRSA